MKLNIKLKDLLNAQKCLNVASDDPTRSYLCSVFFDLVNNCMVATDGYCLTKYPCEFNIEKSENEIIDNGIVFFADSLSGVLKLIFKQFNKRTFQNALESSIVQINYINGETKAHIKVQGAGEYFVEVTLRDYPKYQGCVPNYSGKKTTTIGLNPDLLMNLAKAIQESKSTGVKLEFFIDDNNLVLNPIIVTDYRNKEALGILMPMKV